MRYDEIATQEGVTTERIRQIVTEVLKNRAVDSGADHAKLQLDRLVPALQIAAEAVASGDVRAITGLFEGDGSARPLSGGRRHPPGLRHEARQKLLDKINRLAEDFGIDEDFEAAVKAHLKETGQIPNDAPGEANGLEALNMRSGRGARGKKRSGELDVRLRLGRRLLAAIPEGAGFLFGFAVTH